MITDDLKQLIKKEIQESEKHHRAWTPWRRILPAEVDKPIGCIHRGCKFLGIYVTYHVNNNGDHRIFACADHANTITLRNKLNHKKYRPKIPYQTGSSRRYKDQPFNKAEIAKIRRYDNELNRRFELEFRAKAGDIEAYEILLTTWRLRLPRLEQILTLLGHWPTE